MSKWDQPGTTHTRIRKSTLYLLRRLNGALEREMLEIMSELVKEKVRRLRGISKKGGDEKVVAEITEWLENADKIDDLSRLDTLEAEEELKELMNS